MLANLSRALLLLLLGLPMLVPAQDDEPLPDRLVEGRPARIERHAAFRTIEFERHVVNPGLELFVQRIPRAGKQRLERLAGWYGELARKAEGRLDKDVFGPAGLGKDTPRRPVAVVVLASEGDWANFASKFEKGCVRGSGGGFDAILGAVVTVDPDIVGNKPKDHLTRGFTHGFTHALMQAYAGSDGRSPRPLWLVEGLARYAVTCEDPAGLELLTGDDLQTVSEELAQRMLDGGYPNHMVMPFADMLRFEYRWQHLSQIPMPADGNQTTWWERERALGKQGAALIDLMLSDKHPERRAGFLDFVGRALLDENVTSRFTELCGVEDLTALEIEFWTAVFANRKEGSRGPLTEELLAAIRAPKKVAPTPAPGAAPGEPAVATTSFAPRDPGSTLDRAAWLSRSGDLDGARTLLEELVTAGTTDQRVAREAGRLARAVEARDTWLADAVTKEAILRIEIEGKRKACRVVDWEADRVTLQVGRKDRFDLTLAELPLDQLGKVLGDTLEGCYLRALAGDKRWERDLPKDHDDELLVEDVEVLSTRSSLGRVIDILVTIEDLQGNPAACLPALEELAGLPDDPLQTLLDEAARSGLSGVARAVLDASFQPASALEGLNATEVHLDGDQLRLVYEFDQLTELEDFVIEAPGSRGPAYPNLPLRTLDDSGFEVRNGALQGLGHRALRLKVKLGAPLQVETTAAFGDYEGSHCEHFRQLLLYQRDGRCVNLENMHQRITWFSAGGFEESTTEAPAEYWPNQPYPFGFQLDADGNMTAQYGDEEVFTGKAAVTAPGDYVLCVYTESVISIHRLVLRGRLDDGSLEELRKDWVNSSLERLGLTP